MDKYQEALNRIICNISVARSDYRKSGQASEDMQTLQELIDNYIELEDKLARMNELYANRIARDKGWNLKS